MSNKNKCPLISIIVPVYKTGKYLEQCLQSLILQSYEKIEIILIDDGSPDDCPQLCDQWGKKDKRIRVIHGKNQGISAVRNLGIDLARGEWIMFVDSDDYCDRCFCEKMLTTAIEHNSDIVSCNFYYSWDNIQLLRTGHMSVKGTVTDFTNIQILQQRFMHESIDLLVVWNKLFRKKLFFLTNEKIRFPVGKLAEDVAITYKLYYYANRITIISTPLYYYRQHKGSLTTNFDRKYLLDNISCAKDFILWADHAANELRPLMEHACMCKLFYLAEICQKNLNIDREGTLIKEYKAFVLKNSHNYMKNPYANFKMKVKYLVFRLRLFSLFITIKNHFV